MGAAPRASRQPTTRVGGRPSGAAIGWHARNRQGSPDDLGAGKRRPVRQLGTADRWGVGDDERGSALDAPSVARFGEIVANKAWPAPCLLNWYRCVLRYHNTVKSPA